MTEDTTITQRTSTSGSRISSDSRIFNCSVRSIIALLVVGTVCYMSIAVIKIEEPLYTLVGMVVGFYMGQYNKPKSQI